VGNGVTTKELLKVDKEPKDKPPKKDGFKLKSGKDRFEEAEKVQHVKSRLEYMEELNEDLVLEEMTINEIAIWLEEAFIFGDLADHQHFLRSEYYEILRAIQEGTIEDLKLLVEED
jgi:uncharacterized protein YnzC (UPF0291/DUF896 family)